MIWQDLCKILILFTSLVGAYLLGIMIHESIHILDYNIHDCEVDEVYFFNFDGEWSFGGEINAICSEEFLDREPDYLFWTEIRSVFGEIFFWLIYLACLFYFLKNEIKFFEEKYGY